MQDIEAEAVRAMESLGAKRSDIRVAIGPAICGECFETGPEVPEAIYKLLGEKGEEYFRPEEGVAGKYLVDLKGAVKERLVQLGLKGEHIDILDECTLEHPEKYWSHRAAGAVRGSQANIIML